jgi:MEMO1 family protein
MSASIRLPAVAGRFYPGKPEELRREIASYSMGEGKKLRALGCVVPHAGYVYSGHVAGAVYSRLALPHRFVILCPNHTGVGHPLAIMSDGAWQTPLGQVRLDSELATALKHASELLGEDSFAHRNEHAIEVQIPFLQERVSDFSFVPVVIGTARYDVLEGLGKVLADVLNQTKGEVLLIASSDMNHYESDEVTRIKDARALKFLLELDPRGLYDVITSQHISMCGFGPAIVMLTAAKLRGASKAELIKYATSGDVSGDRAAVVGYAGVAVS